MAGKVVGRDDNVNAGRGATRPRDRNAGNTTTRRMLEGILAMEEEHADDLVSLLENAKV
jgi:hypothetical protein